MTDPSLSFTDYVVGREPPPSVQARRVDGPLGEPLCWNILYRSKRKLTWCPYEILLLMSSLVGTLQMLGCIDRTPSPDLETTERPRQSAAMAPTKRDGSRVADHEQVVNDLRVSHTPLSCLLAEYLTSRQAQLAFLKGEPNTKSETPNTRARVKRERDDWEITGARKKSRGSNTTDVVDLTSD